MIVNIKENIKKLEKIKYDEELSEFDLTNKASICDDRIPVFTTLYDYDWMNYEMKTIMPTKKQGILDITIEYFGTNDSTMKVIQKIDNNEYTHTIKFDTKIFAEFIKKYMTKHMEQWGEKYAFCGEEIIIEFFNKIIENSITYECGKVQK